MQQYTIKELLERNRRLTIQNRAARKIQAIIRGHIARIIVYAMMEENEENIRQEAVQQVIIIYEELLDINNVPSENSLTDADVLDVYESYDGNVDSLVGHFEWQIRNYYGYDDDEVWTSYESMNEDGDITDNDDMDVEEDEINDEVMDENECYNLILIGELN